MNQTTTKANAGSGSMSSADTYRETLNARGRPLASMQRMTRQSLNCAHKVKRVVFWSVLDWRNGESKDFPSEEEAATYMQGLAQ